MEDPDQLEPISKAGHGLHSMQQRLGAFKGCLVIQSNDSGLSLSIQMPCQAVAGS